jgi:hypothetical protein
VRDNRRIGTDGIACKMGFSMGRRDEKWLLKVKLKTLHSYGTRKKLAVKINAFKKSEEFT